MGEIERYAHNSARRATGNVIASTWYYLRQTLLASGGGGMGIEKAFLTDEGRSSKGSIPRARVDASRGVSSNLDNAIAR